MPVWLQNCPTSQAWFDHGPHTTTPGCWYRQVLSLPLPRPARSMSVTRRTLPEDLPFPSIPNVLVTAAFNGLLNVSLDVLCDARYILNHDEYVQAFCPAQRRLLRGCNMHAYLRGTGCRHELQQCLHDVAQDVKRFSMCDYYEVLHNNTDIQLLLRNFLYTVRMPHCLPVCVDADTPVASTSTLCLPGSVR